MTLTYHITAAGPCPACCAGGGPCQCLQVPVSVFVDASGFGFDGNTQLNGHFVLVNTGFTDAPGQIQWWYRSGDAAGVEWKLSRGQNLIPQQTWALTGAISNFAFGAAWGGTNGDCLVLGTVPTLCNPAAFPGNGAFEHTVTAAVSW